MSAAEKRAYVIADNKLALNAGWDDQLLGEELKALHEIDLDFDIGITGFTIGEIDSLVENLEPKEDGDPANDRPAPEGRPSADRETCGSWGRTA